MDPWSQLVALATAEQASPASRSAEAVRIARALRPRGTDLPRLLDLADAWLPDSPASWANPGQPDAGPKNAAEMPANDAAGGRALIDLLLVNLLAGVDARNDILSSVIDDASVARTARLYTRLRAASSGRYVLLYLLAVAGRASALRAFAELMASDPPTDARQVGQAFLPLFQSSTADLAALFPRLMDCLARPQTAALVLDLANHAARKGPLARHPSAERVGDLGTLLGGIVQRLLLIEESRRLHGAAAASERESVSDLISLCISLCDALGLIGDDRVVGKLEQALGVGHRRVRLEAAAALARLGQKRGLDALVAMAAQTATRLRALAYLDELGEVERVLEEQRSPEARAAGELAEWLAQPSQLGLPPTEVELADHCRQYWPGFDQPVDCYLLSFEYQVPQGVYSNVGIVGPLTHALTADLEELVPADVYAVFAGWQAEHPEISEQWTAELTDDERRHIAERLQPLASQGFANMALVKVGLFFGEQLVVATAIRQGVQGTVIVDGDKVEWYPQTSGPRSVGPNEAYWMHKGRKLLTAFNPPARAD